MGKDTVFASLDSAANTAKDDIEYHRDKLKALYEKHEGKPVAHFIEKVFAWRKNPQHFQILFGMFERRAFTLHQASFLARFYSFVSNLMDDSYYYIRWERPKLRNGSFVRDSSGNMESEPCPAGAPGSCPVVYSSGEGSQDFQALIDAVEAEIARRAARAARYEADMASVTFDYDV